MRSPIDTVEVAERLACCADTLDETDRHTQLALFRLLAAGDPVEPGRLAQLRHSAITHLAEDNVTLPMLMAKSRHTSLRSLQKYARSSADAVAQLTAAHDPERRRR